VSLRIDVDVLEWFKDERIDFMTHASRLSDHFDRLDRAVDMDELRSAAASVIAEFRLSAIASGILVGSEAATDKRFHFAHWSPEFMARYQSEDMQTVDAIPRWARGSGVPARYSLIRSRLAPKDPGRRLLEIAAEFGYISGVCIPMRAADGAIGVVAMAGDRPDIADGEFRDLVALGSHVFRRAEEINGAADRARVAPSLSAREVALLEFLVHGHSDREIASLNGITEATVRFHLKNARKKIGAVSRTHLAAKVVALGFVAL
jgi:LuxR family quorum sensing-dependent transcriptional regulator